MFYCVIPAELEAELLEPLTVHYADDPEMTVIVERRRGERRRGAAGAAGEQRVLRDRRRRRISGDALPLYGEQLASAA